MTAQRREESLQDVPLSIVALGRDTLKNNDVTEASRLEQLVPGLRLGRSGADPRPAIRGITTESIQGNADPRVGFYIDEIYQSRTSQTSVPFVDLERVEVQKGPQGTLMAAIAMAATLRSPLQSQATGSKGVCRLRLALIGVRWLTGMSMCR